MAAIRPPPLLLLLLLLLQRSSGLVVPRGRSVSITQSELQIPVEPGTDCKVEVVANEPVTQRVGRLSPQVFDCSFMQDEVKYSHDGSPLLDQDQVMLRVYRFTSSDTLVETVLLRVQVVDSPSGVVELGLTPLVVPQFWGLSNAIDGSVLDIRTRAELVCTIRLLSAATSLPAVGRLVREEDSPPRKGRQAAALCPGNKPCHHDTTEVRFLKTSCQDFLSSGLRYQHLSPPSPQIDYIPIRVELREKATRALLESEAVWLPVLIQGAMQNQPPQASFMASCILEVDQFILTPLTTATLDAKDQETPQERLVFNVTAPPAEGYITHLDDHTKPIRSFTWLDLQGMKVAYQPPNGSQAQRRNYEVEFQVIDGSFTTSAPITVHVSIRASQTNAPRVSWNVGLDLLEGQSRPITWEQLQVVDNDNLDGVYLVAVDGPSQGRLSVRGGKAFMFRIRDLKEGAVVYHHSDSDSTSDHIVFRISDGRHSIRHKFPIHVLPKDDSPPFLIHNVALQVQEGGAVRLEPVMLLASDLDSSDDHILYQIVSPPRAGRLLRREAAGPVDSFLQRDLIQGQILYQHSGEEQFEDSFDLRLSDVHQPPNLSQTYTVVVQVFPVEDQLPVEAPGAVRSLTLKETEVLPLTRAQLHFLDRENPGADLSYAVTRPCFSPLRPGLMDAGRLVHADGAMKKDHTAPALKAFTQHEVNHMKVAYMPPMEDIGPEPLLVQFQFSVSDQHGGTVSDLTFNISVTPVDDQPPQAFTNLLRVEEGGAAWVTEEHLQVQDADSPEEALRVEVQRTGSHGRLELGGRALLQGGGFTLKDLRDRQLRYLHDDSETTEDQLSLRVTDGLNSAQVMLHIQIRPVNDEPPQLAAGLRGGLRCEEGGRVQVTADYLRATDRDSEDSRLSYLLARSPARGRLQRGGQPVDRFSQEDVLRGAVYYLHSGGEVGPWPVLDTITLIISDGEAGGTDSCCPGDAPPPPVPLHGTLPVYDLNVTILPVNNKVPVLTIGESMLAVDEGSSVLLSGGVLGASDPDSPPEQLTFHLETAPLHGFLENLLPPPGFEKSSAGARVESFSLLHLNAGFISYVQSEHQGAEPRVEQLSVSVSDGLFRSAPLPLYILITPTNDEPPTLRLKDFTVKEGGVTELTPSILDGLDLDAPPDPLTFTLARPPAHGRLLRGPPGSAGTPYQGAGAGLLGGAPPVSSFTLEELRQGTRILYMHDDTETLEDAVVLRLTDGVHTAEGTARVTVLPVNDNTPRLLRNGGLEVDPGERRVISSVALEAEDLDSAADQVFYILNAAPRFGGLHLKTPAGWRELRAAQNFTQADVELNRLWYQHAAAAGADGFRGHDSFRFTLSDGDNQAPAQSFFISIHTVHKGAIVLLSKAPTLREGQRVVLNTDILTASDGAGRPEELVYTVSAPPRHGLLHAARRPGVPLASFTQLDLAAHHVCYSHDNSHQAQADSFSFVVTNGVSSRSGSLSFTIERVDRIPPTLKHNAGLRLQGGSTATITAQQLQLTDPDTAPANLSYVITQPPRQGKLLLRGEPLPPPARFSQADVDSLDVAYWHRPGSSAEIDRFYFLPTDGNNRGHLEFGQLREEPAVFNIQVDRVDRTPPSLTALQSPSAVVDLGGGRYGIFITSRHLQASDPDSPQQQLQFSIRRPPRLGFLENAATGASIRGRFSQLDLDQRAVLFLLPADVEETADSFQFQLSDPAGNSVPPQTLELSWSRVQLSATCYRTCETATVLQIQIQRSGRSMDPAYVAIQVEEGSAKPGRDFTHSSAGLIQFDPGVNVKIWNVYPTDDGLEENHETFTVTLKSPQNAVLGQRTSATVEIMDPRRGRCDPEAERPPPPSAAPPQPPQPEEDPVTDIEAELLWENPPHPPRGDVPNRQPDMDYEDVEPQDQAEPQDHAHAHAHGHGGRLPDAGAGSREQKVLQPAGRRAQDQVWTFHSLTALRLEELRPGATGGSRLPEGQPAGDAHQVEGPAAPRQPQLQQHKAGRSASGSCPDGWTLHRRSCYMVSPSVASWASADRTCSLLFNGSLSSVHSRKHLSWLWRLTGRKPFWIGSDSWTWAAGHSSFNLSAPPAGQSDVGSECALVTDSQSWSPTSCSSETQHAFICWLPAQTR